jgi:hypothetical protein
LLDNLSEVMQTALLANTQSLSGLTWESLNHFAVTSDTTGLRAILGSSECPANSPKLVIDIGNGSL